MNKSVLLVSRILVTMLVAAIVGTVLSIAVMFILSNTGVNNDTSLAAGNAVFYTILGLATGYRLNDLVRQYKNR